MSSMTEGPSNDGGQVTKTRREIACPKPYVLAPTVTASTNLQRLEAQIGGVHLADSVPPVGPSQR